MGIDPLIFKMKALELSDLTQFNSKESVSKLMDIFDYDMKNQIYVLEFIYSKNPMMKDILAEIAKDLLEKEGAVIENDHQLNQLYHSLKIYQNAFDALNKPFQIAHHTYYPLEDKLVNPLKFGDIRWREPDFKQLFFNLPKKKLKLKLFPKNPIPEGELCVICYAKAKELLFRPCGHFVSCIMCYYKLKDSKYFLCPVCRGEIHNVSRTISFG